MNNSMFYTCPFCNGKDEKCPACKGINYVFICPAKDIQIEDTKYSKMLHVLLTLEKKLQNNIRHSKNDLGALKYNVLLKLVDKALGE